MPTQADIDTEIDRLLPTNNNNQITAANVRQVLHDLNSFAAVSSTVLSFNTRANLLAASIPAGIQIIQNLYYATPGDLGGAPWKLAVPQATDPDTIGYGLIQTADGQFWSYVPETRGVNAKAFGAIADASYSGASTFGTDSTIPIQKAIDYAMRNSIRIVFLPGGSYKITNTLQLGWGETFHSVNLEGDYAAYAPGLSGTVLFFTAVDRQCVNVQGGRTNYISHINFWYAKNYDWVTNNITNAHPGDPLGYPQILPASPSLWVDPSLTTALNQHSPLAAITIDAFSGAANADHYPNLTFPIWTGLSAQYNKPLTSAVHVRDCSFSGWPVAIASGINTDNQGDFLRVTDCVVNYGAYGISVCNTQSRNVEVRNIEFVFLNTLLDNSSFGSGGGTWNGPIENLSGGRCYRIFNFNLFARSLTISNLYTEGGCRLIGVWNSNYGLALKDCVISLGDSQHGMSRALVENNSTGNVTFEGCSFDSGYGIQHLVYGGSASTLIGPGNLFACGLFFSDHTVAGYKAKTYGGGYIINGGAHYPFDQNRVKGLSLATYSFLAGFDSATAWSDEDVSATDVLYSGLYREGTQSFRDMFTRKWHILQSSPLTNPLTVAGLISKSVRISGMSQTGDSLTFTWNDGDATTFGHNNWSFDVGDILIDQPTGTLFVVTVKSGGSPSFSITTKQVNNFENYVGTGWVNLGTPAASSGGAFQIIRTNIQFSKITYFGDFTSGSANVANVHAGDSDGTAAVTHLPVGMLLYSPSIFGAVPAVQQPITGEFPVCADTYINTVTNGSPASLTLTRNAIATGRYPISPLFISGRMP